MGKHFLARTSMPYTLPLLTLLGLSCVLLCRSWTAGNIGRKPSLLFSKAPEDDEVDRLRRKAEQLRREVDQLEKAKNAVKMDKSEREKQMQVDNEELRKRYSAILPILKPDGTTMEERCNFKPRFNSNNSFITTIEASLPLGIVLGECDDGSISIDEVAESSNGAKAGLRRNDLVRAITACKMELEMPTWQLMAGGIGIPKTKRFMYSSDNKPLEEVMAAVTSNRMDPSNRPMLLVIERVVEE